jgi:putative NADH-flavin reductase
VFDIAEKSSKFLLEIITLVPSVNKMGSDKVFIVGGRSSIYLSVCLSVRVSDIPVTY